MTDIRLLREPDYDEFIRVTLDAYPGMGMIYERDRDKIREKMEERLKGKQVGFYGAFRDNRLLGVMRIHDYSLNYRGAVVKAGGLGGVAVDLTCKRDRVAGDMIRFYLEWCREQSAPIAILWPFRPDFYRKIGFGYGGTKYRYSLLPSSLPDGGERRCVSHVQDADYAAMLRCYERIFARGHGMVGETETSLRGTVGASNGGKAVVFRDGDEVRGFMIYRFKKAHENNFVLNDLHVEECVYEGPEVLAAFLGYLHTQKDQVRRVVMDLPDPDFHYAVFDPRNDSGNMYPSVYHESACVAVGPMYMAVDPAGLLRTEGAGYGDGEMNVEFRIRDTWWGRSDGAVQVRFGGRRAEAASGPVDVKVDLSSADFSSAVMGAVRLSKLVEYGLAHVSRPEFTPGLERILATPTPPFCMTRF